MLSATKHLVAHRVRCFADAQDDTGRLIRFTLADELMEFAPPLPTGDHKGPPHRSTPPSPLRDHGFRFLIDAYWVTLAFTWYAYIFLPSNSGSY